MQIAAQFSTFRFLIMDPSWRPGVPCRVGDNISDIDTPALVIDLDVMDDNRLALKRIMKEYPNVSVRPHAKAHKCPMIARIQASHRYSSYA